MFFRFANIIISSLPVAILMMANAAYCQDTIILRTYDCAIIDFHLADSCACSYAERYDIRSSSNHTYDIIRINVDSVICMHTTDFIDEHYYLDSVKYLVYELPMTLKPDSLYRASVEVGFNMHYVKLNKLYHKNNVFIPQEVIIKYLKLQASFLCDTPDPTFECFLWKTYMANQMKKCFNKYNEFQDFCN